MKHSGIILFLLFSIGLGAAPIHEAAKRCDNKKITELLQKKVNINAKDHKGWTALIYLAWQAPMSDPLYDIRTAAPDPEQTKCYEGLKMLIKAGADVNVKAKGDQTAIYHAARMGRPEYIQALADAGADPNVGVYDPSHNEGILEFPLTFFEVRPVQDEDAVACVRILLKSGANPNAVDRWGEPALRKAVRKRFPAITKLLVEAGADLHFKDRTFNESPLEMAESLCGGSPGPGAECEKMGEILRILRAAAAKQTR